MSDSLRGTGIAQTGSIGASCEIAEPAAVKSVFEEVVLSYRSVPSGHGYGIAYCNTVHTAMKFVAAGGSNTPATP